MSEENPAPDTVTVGPQPEKTLYLARWSSRFWAWLVDIIIIILFLNIVRGIFDPFWKLPLLWDFRHWEIFALGFETIFFFAYWTVMEGFRGQSIGKMVMNLKVVNRDGTKIQYPTAATESFIKSIPPAAGLPDRLACHARYKTACVQPDLPHDCDQDRL